MLLDAPFAHLVNGSSQEDISTDALRLQAEGDPSAGLPEVVGAADEVEAPSVGDVALRGAGLAKVL